MNLLDGWIESSQTQSCPPRQTIQPSRTTTPRATTDDSGLDAAEWVYTLDGGGAAELLITALKEYAKIDFIKEIEGEIRGAIEHAVFGYNLEEVKKWAFDLGDLLGVCAAGASDRSNGFCMVTIQTIERRRNIAAPGWVIPNFSDEAVVKICVPTDKKTPQCWGNVNDF